MPLLRRGIPCYPAIHTGMPLQMGYCPPRYFALAELRQLWHLEVAVFSSNTAAHGGFQVHGAGQLDAVVWEPPQGFDVLRVGDLAVEHARVHHGVGPVWGQRPHAKDVATGYGRVIYQGKASSFWLGPQGPEAYCLAVPYLDPLDTAWRWHKLQARATDFASRDKLAGNGVGYLDPDLKLGSHVPLDGNPYLGFGWDVSKRHIVLKAYGAVLREAFEPVIEALDGDDGPGGVHYHVV